MLFPVLNILINHKDPMASFLDDIFFCELKRLGWQVIHFWKATVCNFFNLGDILMLQKRK